MHTRYRWLSVAPLGRAQLAKVASAMQAKPYSREAKSGYSLSTIRGDWLEGAYTERVEYVERVTDPLGGELSISRVEFRRTEFRIGVVYPQLELRDPARQVRPLLNLIGDSLDFHVAVTPISVSPLLWAEALTSQGEAVQVLLPFWLLELEMFEDRLPLYWAPGLSKPITLFAVGDPRAADGA